MRALGVGGRALPKQNLFTVGDDPAYTLHHIPGIVVTAKGTVLAWCEARKGGGDWLTSANPAPLLQHR